MTYSPSDNYIRPNWPTPPTIKSVCTTRCYGYSVAPFDQFNLAIHVNDDPVAVQKNQELLIQNLNLSQSPLWLNQIHNTEVVQLNSNIMANQKAYSIAADACYTRESNIVCGVMSADCLSILLCDQNGNEIAAIHAGWRGLLAGVIENTIQEMQTPASQLLAWIGPAIGPDYFEINDDIRNNYISKNNQLTIAFFQPYPKRWFADLPLLCRMTLSQCGVTSIYGGDLCTYKDSERFYSYRRDQGVTGRMATLIWK